jgi:hypothetical protein
MGIYVDAEDIKQHFRGGQALGDETIEELMTEQEYYVQSRLELSSLPANNPILASIVRDLTIAAGIFSLTSPNQDNVVKAESMRREALRRLDEADKNGIGVITDAPPADYTREVINPYPTSFFNSEDYIY